MQNLFKISLFFYCLATIGFFNPMGLVSAQQTKLFSNFFMGILLLLPLYESFRKQNSGGVQLFKKPMACILILFLVSVFMPIYSGYDQSIWQGVVATLPFCCYMLYFSMGRVSVDVVYLNKIIFIIAILGMVAYIINLITFPTIIFGSMRDVHGEGRTGVIRLTNQSIIYTIYTFFVAIENWHLQRRRKWLWYIVLSYLSVFLTFTRQYIVLCTILGLFMLLKGFTLSRKVLYSFLVGIILLFIVPEIPIVKNIMNYTATQYEKNQRKGVEDIRIQDARYFGYEDYDNMVQHLLGHGNPSYHSPWGRQQREYYYYTGRYKVDAGFWGFIWTFGVIAGFLYLIVLFNAIKQKWLPGRYFFLFILGSSFTSAPMLMTNKIILWIMVLYIIDKKQDEVCSDSNIEL